MRRNGARNAVEGGGIGGSQGFLRALFGACLDGCWRDGSEGKGDWDFKRRRVGVRGLPPFRGETAKGWGTRSWWVRVGQDDTVVEERDLHGVLHGPLRLAQPEPAVERPGV